MRTATDLLIDHAPFPFAAGDDVRHLKSGGCYRVLAYARLEATLEVCCVYQHSDSALVWVRPITEMHDGRFVRCEGGVR